jgi:hypothetical protein
MLDQLPESVMVSTIMLFLGPKDVICGLGSMNKTYREMVKSADLIWKEFCSWRDFSIVKSMREEIEKRKRTSGDYGSHFRLLIEESEVELKRLEGRLPQFVLPQQDAARDYEYPSSYYEHYKKCHSEFDWRTSDDNSVQCCQENSPKRKCEAYGPGVKLYDFFCWQAPVVSCSWVGCVRGYCTQHIAKQWWDNNLEYDDNIKGLKWNKCNSCGLGLCYKCNVKIKKGSGALLQWIEPINCQKSACVDCRKNLLGGPPTHAFCSNCTENPWTIEGAPDESDYYLIRKSRKMQGLE